MSEPNQDRKAGIVQEDLSTLDRGASIANRLNWLRAGVLGANDGIVSVAGIVVGVAGASVAPDALLIAGVAGLAAGAMSMAAGEYVSVSTQRDTEKAVLAYEQRELEEDPENELLELTHLVQEQGLDEELAHKVAVQLTKHDALTAHAHYELGIDPHGLTNPWAAAGSSLVSFVVGAIIPLITIVLSPDQFKIPATVVAVVVALAITGITSAKLGGAQVLRATLRNIAGGLLAMGVTYWIGRFFGVTMG